MKLFVGSLPFEVSEGELKELFNSYGDLISVKLITDRETGRSRGFGFVEVSSEDEGERAIKELNGSNLKGRNIVVKLAHERSERPNRRT